MFERRIFLEDLCTMNWHIQFNIYVLFANLRTPSSVNTITIITNIEAVVIDNAIESHVFEVNSLL